MADVPAAAGAKPGTLVIAGGAIREGNSALYRAFIDAMPKGTSGQIAIISAASASPVASAAGLRDVLLAHGAAPAAIVPVALAMVDDASTHGVDERDWAHNAQEPSEVAKIEAADAIWISGGDQSRLAALLYDAHGGATPMLQALHRRHAAGAVIGGTSAGAAAMSDPMITAGDSLAALLDSAAAGEPLGTGRGLGFFEFGLVDQHFDEQARLGRLAVALERLATERRIGFGVGENTALVFDGATHAITVVGTGNVTIVDGRSARWHSAAAGKTITDLQISVLSPGDTLRLDQDRFTPAAYLRPTVGHEYHDQRPVDGGGIAIPFKGLAQMLGEALLDNRSANELERVAFVLHEGDGGRDPSAPSRVGTGAIFRFLQTQRSQGYWGHDPDNTPRYSIRDVTLHITPVTVAVGSVDPSPSSQFNHGTLRGEQHVGTHSHSR